MRKWTINGRFATKQIMGVTRYARQVVKELDELLGEGHPAFSNLSLEIIYPKAPSKPLMLNNIREKVFGVLDGYAWEQMILPMVSSSRILNLCNTGPAFMESQITCIHGMNTNVIPESYSLRFRVGYGLIRNQLGRRSRVITTVSNFSKAQLEKWGVATGDKITIAPCGCDHAATWNPRASTLSLPSNRPYVFSLGTKGIHKNVGLLLRIAEDLDALGINIYLSGGVHTEVFRGEYYEPKSNVYHLGFVSDDDLARLYRGALCFAFPSTTEGFGIPPLEAYVHGCPVVASHAGSIPEVLGNSAVLLDPYDAKAWIEAIAKFKDDGYREARVNSGKSRTDHFTWKKTAEIYANLMSKFDD